MSYKLIIQLCVFVAVVTALPAEDTSGQPSRNAIGSDSELDSGSKKYIFSLVDKVLDRDSIVLTEGVTIVKVPGAEKEETSRSADSSVESLILNRIQNFLHSHTIKVELKGNDILNAVTSTGRALEDVSEKIFEDDESPEARGKKKKAGKILGPLIMAIALKAAALLPLILGAIALIAGKALLIGKIALVLSAVIGLKKLLSQEKHVTYEVVAHPHHSASHTSSHGDSFSGGFSGSDASSFSGSSSSHGGGGWGRSYDAQELAYKSQIP